MAQPRITDEQLWDMFTEVSHLLALPETALTWAAPTLYVGDHLNKIQNRLVVDTMQLWYDGMAGITKRDCFNALRIMKSTLALVAERQVKMNQSKAARSTNEAMSQIAQLMVTDAGKSKADDDWAGMKLYLVCNGCGEAFDDLTAAKEHGEYIPGPNPDWCGEDGFAILPEEEAM